ncbi:MAG: IS110 family transposase [Acholeplasmatales bacterium]|nr:IS110 family transposase [Acholeplasmatales bacterium]
MKGFCISLDVSKGSSFYQGFKGLDEPITKPKKIGHNLEGFKELLKLKDSIKKEYNSDCIVIFEATGIYHKPLQTFLDEHEFKYAIISPLLSAKVRKSDIRGTKTDAKDCASISKVFYLKELRIYSKMDEIYGDLKEKCRYYDFLVDEMKRWKVEFRRLLDIIYPGFDKIFDDVYTDYVQNLLLEYSHPEIIRKKRLDTIAKFIEKHTCHKEAFSLKQAQALKDYAENCASGCSYKSYLVSQFDTVIHNLNAQIKHLEIALDEIVELAKNLPNYEIIKSIPGIGSNLTSRILAELGDIDRFDNASQLVAYAGIDPQIYQSGQISGLHLKISKKGNKKLRCLLYLAVTCMIKTNRDTKIVEFYKRKKADGLAARSALVASMNKLLRIIHSLCKNGCLFK